MGLKITIENKTDSTRQWRFLNLQKNEYFTVVLSEFSNVQSFEPKIEKTFRFCEFLNYSIKGRIIQKLDLSFNFSSETEANLCSWTEAALTTRLYNYVHYYVHFDRN